MPLERMHSIEPEVSNCCVTRVCMLADLAASAHKTASSLVAVL